jgi:hypothetical protein
VAKIVNRGDRPTMTKRPELPVRITERKQIKSGHRGVTYQWLPTGQELRIVTATGQTGALSPGVSGASAVNSHPPDASGVIIMLTINANTNTAGQARGIIFRDVNGTNGAHSALHVSQEMGNNTWKSRIVGVCPYVDGGVYWGTEVNGTVNYDFLVDIVGWVLE